MTEHEQLYNLSCPHCHSTQLLVRKEDLDEGDEGFIGNPQVGCLNCMRMMRVSELEPVESSAGQILHMVKGGDA